MPITAICQACQHRFQAPDAFAGKRVKCRHCGQVFQVPAASPTAAGNPASPPPSNAGSAVDLVSLESLAGLESGGSLSGTVPRPTRTGSLNGGTAVNRSGVGRPAVNAPPPPPANRGRPVDDDDDEDTDDEFEEEGDKTLPGGRRPNFPVLSYPGAALVDQGLPLALLILGLGWLALLVSGDDEAAGMPVIKLCRFLIPVLMYWAVVFPFVYGMLGKAAHELNYNLPPTPKMRAFGAYLPAFVFGLALWILGQGSLPGMVVGLTMGLVVSSALLFLLFRLREAEVATTVSYAAGGFAIGAVLTVLLMMGLSFATAQAVIKDKGQKTIPISPFATGLAWAAKPPAEPPPELRLPNPRPVDPGTAPTVTPPVDALPVATLSPAVSDVRTLTFPSGAGTTLLQPLSDTPVIGLVRPGGEGGAVAMAWDAAADKQVGVEVPLPAGQSAAAVISDGGTYLAHIVTWPRRSIHFAAFATGRTVAKIDLDPQLQDPVLFGFVGADRLLVRGTVAGAPVSDLGAALGVKAGPTPVLLIVNLTDPKQNKTVSLPTVAATGFPLAVSAATQRLAIATQRDGVPIVAQINLTTGQPVGTTINLDIDHSIPVSPTGFTYTADGKRVGILFEQAGNAALLSYDANTGGDPAESDFPAPAGIVPKSARDRFKGNALASLDADAWVAYGQRLIDAHAGDAIAPLLVDGVTDQRVLQGGRIELITSPPGSPPVLQVVTIDPAKYHQLPHGSPTTKP